MDNNRQVDREMPDGHKIIVNNIKRELAHIDMMSVHDRVELFTTFNKGKQARLLEYGSAKILDYNDLNELEQAVLRPRILFAGGFFLLGSLPMLTGMLNPRKRGYTSSPLKKFIGFGLGNAAAFMTFNEASSYLGMREEIKRSHALDLKIDEIENL